MAIFESQKTNKISRLRTIEELSSLPDNAIIGTNEAAVLISRGRETLRRWRRRGIGPAFLRHPIDRDRAEYSIGEIRKWLSERLERPGQ